jgi:Na+/proline symporter
LIDFFWHYKWDILAGVIPRLAYTGFSFAQPFLVQRVLDFLSEAEGPNSHTEAYYLIAAYGIVYVGLAVRVLVLLESRLVLTIFGRSPWQSMSTKPIV